MSCLSRCRILSLALFLWAGCAAPPSDASLMADDKRILADFESLQVKFNANQISRGEFKSGLESLQGREERVFDEARHHKFTDPVAGNYFYRMRLKFPSPITETLKDVQ